MGYHSHEEGSSVPEPISPLAPGPLSHLWLHDAAQTRGFDQQAGVLDYPDKRTDAWDSGIDDEHSGSDDGMGEEWFDGQEMVVADWEKRPGETSITYAARLYLSNLNPDCSHEGNCERLLRQASDRTSDTSRMYRTVFRHPQASSGCSCGRVMITPYSLYKPSCTAPRVLHQSRYAKLGMPGKGTLPKI